MLHELDSKGVTFRNHEMFGKTSRRRVPRQGVGQWHAGGSVGASRRRHPSPIRFPKRGFTPPPPPPRSDKIVPVGGGAGEAQKWGNHSSNKHQGLKGRREERVVEVSLTDSNLLLCHRQHLIPISSMPCWSGRQGAWTKKI